MVIQIWLLIGVVVGLLTIATAIGQVLKRQSDLNLNPAAVATFNTRLRAWWIICCLVALAFVVSPWITVVLFGFLSFWALREFITLTPTRPGDHRALFWVFFLFTPMQYFLVGMDSPQPGLGTYELYSIAIPVYGFLFIPARVAIAGDFKRFLERIAKIQCGLLVCVYFLSFAPAMLFLNLESAEDSAASPELLLFFFVVMVLFSDAMQFVWGRAYGKHVIAPSINATRTWEGMICGAVTTALVGMALYWATPFPSPWQAALMSLIISVMAFAGGMTMSAIKRDRGVKDYGTLVEGHSGLLDRIDSICFAAPVFYHVTRYFFTAS
ncbi:MAG: phosphatidate cytidylyltransferase [Pirellulales bacterium]|nr:phosphatidate cytidylyltransferase [Pirellulales bacterium]